MSAAATADINGAEGFGQVPRQASIRFSGLAFDKLLGYAFALLIVKTYGPAAFGIYLFGVGLIEVTLSVVGLGLDRAVIRSVASLNASNRLFEVKNVIRDSLWITLPLSLLVAGLTFVLSEELAQTLGSPELAPFMRFAVFAVPLSIVADGFLRASEGLGKQGYVTIVRLMCEPAIKTGIALVLFLVLGRKADVSALGIAYLGATLVSAILSYAVYNRVVPSGGGFRGTGKHAAELLRVGLPFCALTSLTRVLARTDLFLVFSLVSATTAAQYTVAVRTALLPTMIGVAVEAAFRPSIAFALAKGRRDRLKVEYHQVSRATLMLCLPACAVLAVFPQRVLAVIGVEFASVAPVVSLVTIGAVVTLSLGPLISAFAMQGQTRIPLTNAIWAGATDVLLSILLIPQLGPTGAAIGQLAGMTVASVLNAVAAYRLMQISGVGRSHLSLLVAALVATAVGVVANSFAPSDKYTALALITVSVLLSYTAALAIMGFTHEDRQMLRRLLARNPEEIS
jgi:O-antigen/teichoic acid export membrane protein